MTPETQTITSINTNVIQALSNKYTYTLKLIGPFGSSNDLFSYSMVNIFDNTVSKSLQTEPLSLVPFTTNVPQSNSYYPIAADFTPYSSDMIYWPQTFDNWQIINRPQLLAFVNYNVPSNNKFIFTESNIANEYITNIVLTETTSFFYTSLVPVGQSSLFDPDVFVKFFIGRIDVVNDPTNTGNGYYCFMSYSNTSNTTASKDNLFPGYTGPILIPFKPIITAVGHTGGASLAQLNTFISSLPLSSPSATVPTVYRADFVPAINSTTKFNITIF